MKTKQLLILFLTLGFVVAKSQCNISLGNVNQSSILCNGGDANLSLLVNGGTATYSYTFGASATNTITPDTMIWAQGLLSFSSEYDNGSWSAANVLYAPDVYPSYGDLAGTWTTETDAQREYISVSYPTTNASKVLVYETNEPGSCDTVYVRSSSTGIWHIIYTGTAGMDPAVATIKSYTIPSFIGAVNGVRLAVDGSIATYYEIDAIGLVTDLFYPINLTGITAGTYTLTVTDDVACTYTTSFNFSEPAPLTFTQNLTICSNQNVSVGSSTYNTPGNYTDILTSVNGCDSTVYTNLTVNSGNATYHTIDTVLCSGQSLTIGSIIHNVSGNYLDTLTNAAGCDSIIDVTLMIYSTNIPMVTINEIPNNNTATGGTASADAFYGTNYPADAFDGDFDQLGWGNNGDGFPSWLEYDYGTGNSKVVKAYSFFCSSNMVGGWGYNGYDPGEWNFQGYNGSDWVNLDTVVDNNPVQNIWNTYFINNTTAYQKYRMFITGTIDGSYVMITELKLLTYDSCANKLFVANPNDVANDTITSYQWQVNGTNVGTNTDSLFVPSFNLGDVVTCQITTNNACATTTTALGSHTINTGAAVATASLSGLTLTAYPAGASYQWFDCTNNIDIIGATNQNYTATTNGSYAVIITSGSCSKDTSNCIVISTVGLKDNIANATIRMYPNPNNGVFTLEVNNETADVQISDMLGNIIYNAKHAKGKETLDLSNLANGIYLVKVNSNNNTSSNRLIINK